MVKVSVPFRKVTRGSNPMKALQGNRTHGSLYVDIMTTCALVQVDPAR